MYNHDCFGDYDKGDLRVVIYRQRNGEPLEALVDDDASDFLIILKRFENLHCQNIQDFYKDILDGYLESMI